MAGVANCYGTSSNRTTGTRFQVKERLYPLSYIARDSLSLTYSSDLGSIHPAIRKVHIYLLVCCLWMAQV